MERKNTLFVCQIETVARPISCRAPSATLGPVHGYAIAARLEQVSHGAIQLNMGTLYPGLMRLEQRGLVRGRWGVTENNRKARFYAITAAGRRRLASEKADWERTVSIMHSLLAEPQ